MTGSTVQRCPLCSAARSDLFDRRAFRGIQVTNRICANCGLVFQSPRMTDDELAAFYQQEYRQLYQGDQEPGAKDLTVQRQRAQALAAFVQASGVNFSRHLDIGCSAGLLLELFQDIFGNQSVGIEPGDAYRAYAQSRGLDVVASLEDLAPLASTRFDLISLIHVLEHLPDPVTYLAHLRQELLSPVGWLLIEVPNLYAHDCFEVAHLVSYSPHTLQQVLGKAGFVTHTLLKHGKPRSNLTPLYITLLARPLNPPPDPATLQVIPERNVKIKRQLGLLRRRILERLYPRRAWLPLPTS